MPVKHAARSAALLAATGLTLAVGGCGGASSDEQQVRETVTELGRALDRKDSKRACKLLTPRAEAQYTTLLGLFSGPSTCEDVLKDIERDDDEQWSDREIDDATVTVRGSLATMKGGRGAEPVGLREVDGGWRVDNILNPSLREQERGDPRLARGTDRQQIRATMRAANDAIAHGDHERTCSLMSYGAEAQIFVAAAFASLSESDGEGASDLTCAKALGMIDARARKDVAGGLATELPSGREIAAARIVIGGPRASVRLPGRPADRMIRIDGRWLIDADISE
jgi:hypothetical protein